MNQNIIFVSVLLFLGACGSLEKMEKLSGLNEDQEVNEYLAAIKVLNVVALKKSLGDTNDLSEKSYMIDKTIESASDSEIPGCPDKMIDFLLAGGATPTESGIEASLYTNFLNKNSAQNKYKTVHRENNLSKVMEMGCPTIAKSFAKKMDNGEIEKALFNFLEGRQFKNTLEHGQSNCYTGNNFKGQVSSLSEVYGILSEKCPDCSYVEKAKPLIATIPEVSKRAAACIAANTAALKNQELQKSREAEVDAYLDTPLGNICDNLTSMRTIRNAIAKEEEVGRRSGYVRKEIIYQGHKNIIFFEGKLAENKKAYRSKMGREFKSEECRDHIKKSEY